MPGEDPATSSAVEARRWADLYQQLVAAVDAARSRLEGSQGPAADRELLDRSLEMAAEREAFWRRRHDELVGLLIDAEEATASYNGRSVHLTRRELQLLHFLVSHHDRFWRASQLSSRGWGDSSLPVEQVRTYISRLRAKLEHLQAPGRIVSRNPLGYRYSWDDAHDGSHAS
jgi:DNA-binding response OmpR family regulator